MLLLIWLLIWLNSLDAASKYPFMDMRTTTLMGQHHHMWLTVRQLRCLLFGLLTATIGARFEINKYRTVHPGRKCFNDNAGASYYLSGSQDCFSLCFDFCSGSFHRAFHILAARANLVVISRLSHVKKIKKHFILLGCISLKCTARYLLGFKDLAYTLRFSLL